MHFTNDDMKNQIIGNDGNVYELDVRGGKPSEEKECKCPSEYVPSGDCPLHGEPSEESVTEIEIGSKVAPLSEESWEEYVKEWSKQGRSEEQIWAVRNFMTGQGALMIQAERKKVIEEILSNRRVADETYRMEWVHISDIDELKGRKL